MLFEFKQNKKNIEFKWILRMIFHYFRISVQFDGNYLMIH